MNLMVSPQRLNHKEQYETGILVRAQDPTDNKFINADIGWLTLASLHQWLKSRGGDNPWAESTVCILLGYSVADIEKVTP